MDLEWSAFFSGMAGFAGTVFAITLAARTINEHSEAQETPHQKQTRLWESIGVTFELAAAALLSILFFIRGTLPATGLATIIVIVGLVAYGLYGYAFMSQHFAKEWHRWWEWGLLAITVFPITAFVISAAYFWDVPICMPWACWPVDERIFAASVEYLVLSGVLQAFLWYKRSLQITSGSQGRFP